MSLIGFIITLPVATQLQFRFIQYRPRDEPDRSAVTASTRQTPAPPPGRGPFHPPFSVAASRAALDADGKVAAFRRDTMRHYDNREMVLAAVKQDGADDKRSRGRFVPSARHRRRWGAVCAPAVYAVNYPLALFSHVEQGRKKCEHTQKRPADAPPEEARHEWPQARKHGELHPPPRHRHRDRAVHRDERHQHRPPPVLEQLQELVLGRDRLRQLARPGVQGRGPRAEDGVEDLRGV